jgi:AraC-like DNA-binding protein
MNVPLDILLRAGGTAVGLVFLLVVAVSAGWRQRGDLMLLIFCAVAYLLCSAPARPCCTSPWTLPLLMGAAGFPFAFWRLAKVVLEDEAAIAPQAWAGLTVLLVSAVVAAPDYLQFPAGFRTVAAIANKAAALGFIGAALWGAWRSWEGDLFEPRRRLRRWLMGYIGAYGLVVMAGEIYLLGARPPVWLDLINAAAIDVTLLATLLFFVQLRGAAVDTLFAPRASPAPAPPPSAGPEPKPAQPSVDEPLLEKLHALMDSDKLYRDPDLSVRSLAERAAIPEYALRRLINEKLGYRNFAAYVNDFRLREVEARLRDPQWARRPILTLALEAGFGSIGPFNRAFRERFGMTPTDFRSSGGSEDHQTAPKSA